MGFAKDLGQDVRFGLRTLKRNPGFTIVTLLTLALGIGANSAMFSVLEGVVLKPFPYPEADRIVFLSETRPGVPDIDPSEPNFEDWRREAGSFEQMSAMTFSNFNLSSPGTPEHLMGIRASATFLSTLRLKPAVGRDFSNADDEPGASLTVLISRQIWKQRFGADPRVAGRALVLNGKTYTVIGVLPAHFHFFGDADLVTPLGAQMPAIYRDRSVDALAVVARLKPGIGMTQAQDELSRIQQQLDRQYPDADRTVGTAVWPLKKMLIGDVEGTLYLLFGAVLLVLLIACANVANLLLARNSMREREFSVRAALGADRSRIARQVLTESLILALVGGGLGIAVAAGAVRLLAWLPGTLPRAESIGLNWVVVAFTFLTAVTVGTLFGAVPALRSGRADLQPALQKGSRGATGGNQRLLSQFVVVQFALTLVLLAGAGLLLRSIRQLWRVNPGFEARHLVKFQVGLSPSALRSADATRAAYGQLLERVRDIPGVTAADLTNLTPLSGSDNSGPFWIGSTQTTAMQTAPHALYFWTGPDYLRTMGIPLLRGRFFTPEDRVGNEKVVVIDEVLAQTFFPHEDPVGKTLTVAHWGTARIVGVAGHVRYWGLDDAGTYNPRQIYIPAFQLPDYMVKDFFRGLAILVRSPLPTAELMPALRKAVYESGSDQPVYAVGTIEDLERESMASRRMPIFLLGAFAGLALMLASVGIFGVVSYSAARRVREIGIRMALGADRVDVLRMILGQGLRMAAIGVAAGVGAVLVLVRVLPSFSRLLYGVGKDDPLTLITVSGGLILIALAGCYVPARRAMRTDPMASLRCE